MKPRDYSPTKKALQINLDESIYGTFAEIGAGQEVARHFFQAGRASQTIAKTISAYDMTFSDHIYGKESRYVCESRLGKMLDHEFSLLLERLGDRADRTRFFAFADTVATAQTEDISSRSHGWMGIRFQSRPGGPANSIVLHVKLWDRFRLQQQDALGILGVNLIHMAFNPPERPEERITYLLDSLNTKRIEVNMIRFSGPDLQHLDNRLLSLELVKQGLTEAVLFGPKSEILHAGDELFRQPVLVQRGTFRPITTANLEITEKVLAQFAKHSLVEGKKPRVLYEITMNSLVSADGGLVDHEDFLHRVDTLSAVGQEVLISNFALFYQMRSFLRLCTDQAIGIVVGASLLPKMFDEKFYAQLPGGILEGMSRLFDQKTRVFVFPTKDDKTCETAKTFSPGPKLDPLYRYLFQNQWITDALDCDDVDTTVHSNQVREWLSQKNPSWKKFVPEKARALIESRQLFGYRP